jgi:hypothetical protein
MMTLDEIYAIQRTLKTGITFPQNFLCIGKGLKYRPFRDLRYVHEADRSKEHVENCWKAGLYSCLFP